MTTERLGSITVLKDRAVTRGTVFRTLKGRTDWQVTDIYRIGRGVIWVEASALTGAAKKRTFRADQIAVLP